jgi:hypothetical protein
MARSARWHDFRLSDDDRGDRAGGARVTKTAARPRAQRGCEEGRRGAREDWSAKANELAHRHIIVDGHIDVPWRSEEPDADGGISEDASVRTPKGDFDWTCDARRAHAPRVTCRRSTRRGAKKMADKLSTWSRFREKVARQVRARTTPAEVRAISRPQDQPPDGHGKRLAHRTPPRERQVFPTTEAFATSPRIPKTTTSPIRLTTKPTKQGLSEFGGGSSPR